MMGRWWGPVFEADRIARARRWQGYALRALFLLPFAIGFGLNWISRLDQFELLTVAEAARIGQNAFGALTGVVLVGVLLIAPAATAGAVCLDKSRGMLAHLFVTDLSDREIILGKLAARSGPVLALVASVLPVASVLTLLGGIDPLALTTLFLTAAGLAVLGCTLALLLSVWASRPQEVLTVVYGIWFVWFLAGPAYRLMQGIFGPPPGWLRDTNPFFLLFEVLDHPGTVSVVEPGLFCLACVLVGMACTLVAVARVRAVGTRSKVAVRRIGWFERLVEWSRGNARRYMVPRLDADPVRWREWHRARPSRWSRWVWGTYAVLSSGAGLGLFLTLIGANRAWWGGVGSLAAGTLGVMVTVGLVLLSTSVASVLTEERQRGSLDVLLCTPLTTRSILWAKWRASYRRVPWLVFWPIVVGALCSSFQLISAVQIAITVGVVCLILAQGAALVSLGLALATWNRQPERATAGAIATMVVLLVGWPFVAETDFGLLSAIVVVLGLALALVLARRGKPGPTLALLGLAVGIAALAFLLHLIAGLLDEQARIVWKDYGKILGCPIVGISLPLMHSLQMNTQVYGINFSDEGLLLLVALWVAIHALAAWGLFEATVATFDRCLDRGGKRRPTHSGVFINWGSRTLAREGRPAGRAATSGPPPR